MDFQFTDEQKDIRKAAREFAENEFPEIAHEIDRKEEFVAFFENHDLMTGPTPDFTMLTVVMREFRALCER